MLGLDMLGLAPGEGLAVSGGAGLLASYAIPLAKESGIHVIAYAAPADEELVRSFGADVVLPRVPSYPATVREVVPEGVAGFFDTALLGRTALPAIRDGGGMVAVRGWDEPGSERGIRVHPIRVSTVLDRTDWLVQLRDLASRGRIALRVAATLRPDDAEEGYRLTSAGGLRGRAVLVFQPDG